MSWWEFRDFGEFCKGLILLVFIYKIVKLKVAMVRLEIIVFTNGERYPILIDNGKNIPHYYSTLWTTSILRSSCSVNTIRNKLYAIRWFFIRQVAFQAVIGSSQVLWVYHFPLRPSL